MDDQYLELGTGNLRKCIEIIAKPDAIHRVHGLSVQSRSGRDGKTYEGMIPLLSKLSE